MLAACPRRPLPTFRHVSNAAYSDEVLPSGLRLIVEPERGTGHVEVVLVLGAGRRQDPPGREGLAHLVEHLALENRHPDGLTRVERLERLGVQRFNGGTGYDTVRYHATAPRPRLAPLVALQTELLLAPLIGVPDGAIAREKSVVLTERETLVPEWLLLQSLSPALDQVAGSQPSLGPATRADLDAFVAAHYRPENATLLVIGDFEVLDGRAEVWAALPPTLRAKGAARPPPAFAKPLPEPTLQKTLPVVPGRVKDDRLVVGWGFPSAQVPTWLAASIAVRFDSVPALKGAFVATLDDQTALVVSVPRDPGLTPVEQLRAVAALAEQTVAEQRPAYWPFPLHDAMLEPWEDRGQARAAHAQRTGRAELPAEAERDGPALATAVREAMGAWRARGVVVQAQPVPAGPLTAVFDDEPPAVDISADGTARIAAVPDLPGLEAATLANGLRVVVVPRPDARLTSVVLVRPGGHTRGPAGVAQLAEQTSDARTRCDAREGTELDADDTTHWLTGTPGQLTCLLQDAAHRASAPLKSTGLDAAKLKWIAALPKATPSPDDRALYREAHAYWCPDAAAIRAISFAQVDGYFRSVSDPARSALVVVGPVDPADVIAQAQTAFARWSASDVAPVTIPAPLPPAAHPPRVRVEADPLRTTVGIRLRCLLPAAPLPAAVVRLTRAVLEHRMWRTRHRVAAIYGVGADHSWSAFAAEVSAFTQAHPDHLEATLRALQATLTAAPTTAELDRARWTVAHLTRRRQADPGAEVGQWLGQLMVTGVPFERLRAVNASSVQVPDAELRAAWKTCVGAQQWTMMGDEAAARAAAKAVFGEEALK